MVSGDVSVACPPPYSFSRASSERAAAALSYSDLWIRIFVCSWLTSPFVPLSGYTNNTDPPQPRQPGWRGLKFANLKRGGGWQRHGCVRLSKCAFPHSPGFACSSQHFHWPSRAGLPLGFPSTAPPPVLIPAVLDTLVVWIPNKTKPKLKTILRDCLRAGLPPSFPSTASLPVHVSAVPGTLAVWIPNQKKVKKKENCFAQ